MPRLRVAIGCVVYALAAAGLVSAAAWRAGSITPTGVALGLLAATLPPALVWAGTGALALASGRASAPSTPETAALAPPATAEAALERLAHALTALDDELLEPDAFHDVAGLAADVAGGDEDAHGAAFVRAFRFFGVEPDDGAPIIGLAFDNPDAARRAVSDALAVAAAVRSDPGLRAAVLARAPSADTVFSLIARIERGLAA